MKFTFADDDHRKHRCVNCAYGRVTYYADGRRETTCSDGMDNKPVVGDVLRCSSYEFSHLRATSNIEHIAWVLEVKKGRIIGFKPPNNDND